MATNTRVRTKNENRASKADSSQSQGTFATARQKPLTSALAVGGAVAAGVFLWSRRNQISDQISDLSDQLSRVRQPAHSDANWAAEGTPGANGLSAGNSGRSQVEIAQEALTLKELGQSA